MSYKPRISPPRGTPRVALPQLEHFMAVRRVSKSELMAHLGVSSQTWYSNVKAGGWMLPDAEAIAARLDVPLDTLRLKGVLAPDVGPAVQSVMLQPEVAAVTEAAVADVTRRLEQAFAQLVRESVTILATGTVPVPAAADPKAKKLRELTALVDAETTAPRARKKRAK